MEETLGRDDGFQLLLQAGIYPLIAPLLKFNIYANELIIHPSPPTPRPVPTTKTPNTCSSSSFPYLVNITIQAYKPRSSLIYMFIATATGGFQNIVLFHLHICVSSELSLLLEGINYFTFLFIAWCLLHT